jgi:hypothetical protein
VHSRQVLASETCGRTWRNIASRDRLTDAHFPGQDRPAFVIGVRGDGLCSRQQDTVSSMRSAVGLGCAPAVAVRVE